MRQAFREWLAASKAWGTLHRAIVYSIEGNVHSATARRRLEELEQRLNAAAEAFEQTQQRLRDAGFTLL
jgi:hypothetical protein